MAIKSVGSIVGVAAISAPTTACTLEHIVGKAERDAVANIAREVDSSSAVLTLA